VRAPSDADGDTLVFTIQNRPAWSGFDTATGQLSGTPSAVYADTWPNIIISVSDGKSKASLPAFTITVASIESSGTAHLTWTPPTRNTDGSALQDLAGYRISYGAKAGELVDTIQVANPGLSAYVIDDLPADAYYFAVRAYIRGGRESADSNAAFKVVR